MPSETKEIHPSYDPTIPRPLETPMEHIALAFSGGGFRAASYGLGVLSYLDHLKFNTGESALSKVRYLSSASGGTIATATYALFLAQGKFFDEYFKHLHGFLGGDKALTAALENLNTESVWKTPGLCKRRNLINAFAVAYNGRTLFEGHTLGELSAAKDKNVHLEEVCFNATDLVKGLTFRQQCKMQEDTAKDKHFTFGNGVTQIDKETSEKLLLADILAASSCFPAGFEPIVYPDDFAHAGVDIPALKKGLTFVPQSNSEEEKKFINDKTFGLMDGGITDNQGLSSLMKADQRRIKGETSFKPFDLILVNDVGSHFMSPYAVPPENGKGLLGRLSLRGMLWLFVGIFLLSAGLITLSYLERNVLPRIITIPLLGAGAFGLGCSLLFILAYWKAVANVFRVKGDHNKNAKELNLANTFSVEIVALLGRYLKSTHLSVFGQLIKARMSSVLALNNDVFLKHIRRLIFEQFYNNPTWTNRRKGNHIYDLSMTNDYQRKRQIKDKGYTHAQIEKLAPTEAIQEMAEKAYQMATTLWYDKTNDEQQLRKAVISCGQYTTCYNLLEYLYSFSATQDFKNLPNNVQARLMALQGNLEEDWERFKNDPAFLYNQYLTKA